MLHLLPKKLVASLVCTMGIFPCPAQENVSAAQERPLATTRSAIGKLQDTLGLKPYPHAVVLIGAEEKADQQLEHLMLEKQPDQPLPWKFDAQQGVLEIVIGSGDICTRRKFSDFRLHLEFAVNEREGQWGNNGNSGVYIQRRYEVQILNSFGREPTKQDCGALYLTRVPDHNASRPAGEWQSFDIAFRAARWDEDKKTENARITVLHNGKLLHDDVEIPNKTGAGRKEGPEAEHIRLQDHGNAVKFRNFWILPLEF